MHAQGRPANFGLGMHRVPRHCQKIATPLFRLRSFVRSFWLLSQASERASRLAPNCFRLLCPKLAEQAVAALVDRVNRQRSGLINLGEGGSSGVTVPMFFKPARMSVRPYVVEPTLMCRTNEHANMVACRHALHCV